MSFFQRTENDANGPNRLQVWSTDIGQYTCLEGILRFILAGTATEQGKDGKTKPSYSVTLPLLYRQYAKPNYSTSVEN